MVVIHHHARINAANAVKVKHRGLIDFNPLQRSTFDHENIPKNNLPNSNPALINARRGFIKKSGPLFLFKVVRDGGSGGLMRTVASSFAINATTILRNALESSPRCGNRFFALVCRENSRSTDATSFPLRPPSKPNFLARALRVLCIAPL